MLWGLFEAFIRSNIYIESLLELTEFIEVLGNSIKKKPVQINLFLQGLFLL